jgi:2-keto-3-deoxy-L-fuconate dehydrogenase
MEGKPMFDLSGKVAVITGGGSGIGEAISRLFAQQGADVHILELNTAQGEKVVAEILEAGGRASCHSCDVSDQKGTQDIFQSIMRKTGRIDISVNNAGIAHVGNVEGTSEEDFDRIYRVNVKGVYNSLHAVVPIFKQLGGGVILNMASIASLVGITDRFAYSMSKGAVLTMTYSIAKDYLNSHIRCNCIAPARIHTPFVDGFLSKNYPGKEQEMFEKLSKTQPIGRMGKPEEVAAMALYLCSEEASFITGTCFPIDGGFVTLNG